MSGRTSVAAAGSAILYAVGAAAIVYAALGLVRTFVPRSAEEHRQTAAQGHAARPADERAIVRALVAIGGAAQRFRSQHPQDGYPPSLAALQGDLAGTGAAGLDATGALAGYVVEYHARPAEVRGPSEGPGFAILRSGKPPLPPGYVLTARPAGQGGGSRSFRLDETGLLRADLGVGLTSPVYQPPDGAIGQLLGDLQRALDDAWSRAGEFPASLASLAAAVPFEEQVRRAGYRVDYERRNDRSGAPTRFALAAAPLRYGESGLRSYELDESGVIRATAEPRPARRDDPPAEDCEILGNGMACSDEGSPLEVEAYPWEIVLRSDLPAHPGSAIEAALHPLAKEQLLIAGRASDGTLLLGYHAMPQASAMGSDPRGKKLWSLRHGSADAAVVGGDTFFIPTPGPVRTESSVLHKRVRDTPGRIWAVASGGQLKWQMQPPGKTLRGMAAAADGTLYVASDRTLQALDAQGAEKWRRLASAAAGGSGPVLSNDGSVVFLASPGDLAAIGSDGRALWVRSDLHTEVPLAATGDGGVVCFCGQGLVRLDRQGRDVWSRSLAYDADGGVEIAGREVRVLARRRIGAYGLADGQLRREKEAGAGPAS